MGTLGWAIGIGGVVFLIWYEIWAIRVKRGGTKSSEILSAVHWGNGIIIALLLAAGFYLLSKIDKIIGLLTSIEALLKK